MQKVAAAALELERTTAHIILLTSKNENLIGKQKCLARQKLFSQLIVREIVQYLTVVHLLKMMSMDSTWSVYSESSSNRRVRVRLQLRVLIDRLVALSKFATLFQPASYLVLHMHQFWLLISQMITKYCPLRSPRVWMNSMARLRRNPFNECNNHCAMSWITLRRWLCFPPGMPTRCERILSFGSGPPGICPNRFWPEPCLRTSETPLHSWNISVGRSWKSMRQILVRS